MTIQSPLAILNPSISLLPVNDLMDELALCENGGSVESVFVDGKPVMLGKRFTAIDEEAILERFCSLRPRIAKAEADVLQSS